MLILVVAGAVGSGVAQTQYTMDGLPTGLEEEIRWRVNRGRYDSTSENATHGTTYTDVPASAGPLAPNQSITLAARHHSEDMAKRNMFQHETIPGSLFYNPTTQPNPWDRMTAEGYSNWNWAGENIAAGYSGAETAYVAWWNSTGHRQNMFDSALREIGNGYYNWSTSTYRHYYTMDLGTVFNSGFLTDTTFRDVNGNGVYDQTEAVGGVAVLLRVGSSWHSQYDISTAVGSFAIPIQSISGGATVQVILSNTTTASLTLSIPRDYRTYATVVLGAGEARSYGTFTRPGTIRNFGFRDVAPGQVALAASRLNIAGAGTNIVLSWASGVGLEYQAQWTTNFLVWNAVSNSFRPGTGMTMIQTAPANPAAPARFYRLLIRRP